MIGIEPMTSPFAPTSISKPYMRARLYLYAYGVPLSVVRASTSPRSCLFQDINRYSGFTTKLLLWWAETRSTMGVLYQLSYIGVVLLLQNITFCVLFQENQ